MIAILLSLNLASAEEAVAVDTTGDLRWFAAETSDFPVDADGTQMGQGLVVDQRLRLGGGIDSGHAALRFEGDFFSGQLAGDPWNIPGTIDERHREQIGTQFFRLRKTSLRANLSQAQIEVGVVNSHWGLGMLANDGAHDPMFGHTEFGDTVLRARMTTKPSKTSPWFITFAFDRVLSDDLAPNPQTQWATQGIFSVLWREADDAFGLYAVKRSQIELEKGRYTRAAVIDLFGDTNFDLGTGSLRLAAEAAGISGRTNRATTYESQRDVRILSAGATSTVSWTNREGTLTPGITGGWASGDGNPDDGVSNDFTFDRDFGVGMVLFDEVMGGIEAATHTHLTNPEHAGQAPDGVETTVTEGAFRRAVFIQPHTEVQATDWLGLRAGVVLAWATGPVSQAFYTYRNGGTPMNHHQQPTSSYELGKELNWAIEFGEIKVAKTLGLSANAQGGHAFLGDALQGAGPDQVNRYMGTFRVRW